MNSIKATKGPGTLKVQRLGRASSSDIGRRQPKSAEALMSKIGTAPQQARLIYPAMFRIRTAPTARAI